MLNIICVKIGEHYPSVLVNRLYAMCKKNVTTPFRFFCYTDDGRGINQDINIIPFVDHNLEVVVHNKLFLFSKEFDQYLDSGTRVYFDLDIIIKHNIDHVISFNNKELTVIRASWRPELPHGKYCPDCYQKKDGAKGYSHHHQLNSSCMIWEAPYTQCIWDHFIKNPDYYTLAFPLGMDSFLNYEHKTAGTNIHLFPERWFWSHNYGVDNWEREAIWHNTPDAPFYKFEEDNKEMVDKIPIVLLNGPNTPFNYRQYKQFYDV